MKTLLSLFAYKTWANSELLELLRQVSPETHPQELRTAIRTLNHVYVSDRIFRAHLASETHPFSATNTTETPALTELRARVTENDAWFERYIVTVSDEKLQEIVKFTFIDGDTATMTREEMLLHVVTHGGYHRGNVGQLLESISLSPPRDLYTKFLHSSEPGRRHANPSFDRTAFGGR